MNEVVLRTLQNMRAKIREYQAKPKKAWLIQDLLLDINFLEKIEKERKE